MLDLQIITTSYQNEDVLNMNFQHSILSDINYKWINVINHKNPVESIYPEIINIQGVPKEKNMDGSIHHGLAVNKAILEIDKSRYILILDIDFFIILPIKKILEYIQLKNLDFFGATYPENTGRILQKEFPCGFCMFINSKTIDTSQLNFLPDFENSYDLKKDIYKDMSYRIYDQYNKTHKYEALKSYSKRRPEEYFFNNELFGTHFRIKRHRKSDDIYRMSVQQIKDYLKGEKCNKK